MGQYKVLATQGGGPVFRFPAPTEKVGVMACLKPSAEHGDRRICGCPA